ncbi:MAG: hypothetical protein IPJ71_02895 [Bdellovibrionales bacterium]|nr:hypothetical protein [Bdellovibrionales bacterium]
MNFFFGFFIFLGCFHSFLAEGTESDAEAIETSLKSAGRDYLQLFVTDSQEIPEALQSNKDFRLEYERKGQAYKHQHGIQLRNLYRLLREARLYEEKNGLGNDLSVKFILEMRKTALEILQTRYLSAGEGVYLIFDIFELLEELADKELPRNYFLLEAADAIRKNADPLMDLKAKDLILSGVFVQLSVDRGGPQSLRHLFGILDFLDSELRIASLDNLAFLADQVVGFYIKRSYDFIGVRKTPDPNSPYLEFDIDRIRIHLVKLVKELLPKIANEKARIKLERDLEALQVKFSEAERILSAQQRAKSKITAGCRKRLSLLGSAD